MNRAHTPSDLERGNTAQRYSRAKHSGKSDRTEYELLILNRPSNILYCITLLGS